jgi:chromosome segregation ATPase
MTVEDAKDLCAGKYTSDGEKPWVEACGVLVEELDRVRGLGLDAVDRECDLKEQVKQLAAQLGAREVQLQEAMQRYQSAVKGRSEFRTLCREQRTELESLRERVAMHDHEVDQGCAGFDAVVAERDTAHSRIASLGEALRDLAEEVDSIVKRSSGSRKGSMYRCVYAADLDDLLSESHDARKVLNRRNTEGS